MTSKQKKQKSRTVVRVVTTSWYDGKGVHFKRSLNVLKRKSHGLDILKEDCSCRGAEECMNNIADFLEVRDGIYELVICNISKNWETGDIEDWDLTLIPYEDEKILQQI